MFAAGMFSGAGILVSAVLGFAGAFGVPRWLLSFLRKRRETKFLEHFPDARIEFEPVPWRQAIVDTWPADVDDSRARRDWGHAPKYLLADAMSRYLVPALVKRYADRVTPTS